MEDVSALTQGWELFSRLLTLASAPAGLAIILAIGSTQVMKMLQHRLPFIRKRLVVAGEHKLRPRELWILSWILTVVAFPLLCMVMNVPVKEHMPLGFVAGFFSPLIVKVMKKVGLDLDKWTAVQKGEKSHGKS